MIAILSDIHGNYVALEQVLKAIDSFSDITELYCLGDMVGYYPQINEVCFELRRRNAKCIIGNHDWYMLADTSCPRSQTVNDTIDYQKTIIRPENLEWLRSLPVYRVHDGVSMVHGGWTDPINEYLWEPQADYFRNTRGRFFTSGHTHFPRIDHFGDKLYCNPGSVGQPRDGDNRASFALWDGQQFTLHRVAYDFDKIGELMELAGFNGYYYQRLAIGAKDNGWYDGKHR